MNEEQQNGAQSQAAEANLNPDLAGYPSVEALVKAYRESGKEAQRQRERADQFERTMSEQLLEPVAANPRTVKQRDSRPEDRLQQYGVPVDALTEFVQSQVQGLFAPIAQGMNARTELLSRYPDYTKFESDVAAFVQSDPKRNQTYQRMFAADPAGAFEWAFLAFGADRRKTAGNGAEANPEEMAHAGLPAGRNGESLRQPQGNDAAVQRAWNEYQRTGSKEAVQAYAKARLRTVVTDEFLNQ